MQACWGLAKTPTMEACKGVEFLGSPPWCAHDFGLFRGEKWWFALCLGIWIVFLSHQVKKERKNEVVCVPSLIGEWKHNYDYQFEFLHCVTLHLEIFFAIEINLVLALGIKSNQLKSYKT